MMFVQALDYKSLQEKIYRQDSPDNCTDRKPGDCIMLLQIQVVNINLNN